MATNTTNFTLKKPAYTDTADIADINGNMDKVDTALQGLGTGLAIISKANTHDAISSGQYVYVHGHGTLAEGLYTAKSNIAANATLSTSNLSAVTGGGLNALINDMNDRARTLRITASDNTWGAIWNKLSVMPLNQGFTVYVSADAISVFTDGNLTYGYWFGTGMRLNATEATFTMVSSVASYKPVTVSFSNTTSSSQGIVSIYRVINDISIQKGSVSNSSINVNAGTYGDIDVAFPAAFSASPTVVVGMAGSTASLVMDNGKLSYVVISTTTTGFTVRMFNNSSIGRSPMFNWIAMVS